MYHAETLQVSIMWLHIDKPQTLWFVCYNSFACVVSFFSLYTATKYIANSSYSSILFLLLLLFRWHSIASFEQDAYRTERILDNKRNLMRFKLHISPPYTHNVHNFSFKHRCSICHLFRCRFFFPCVHISIHMAKNFCWMQKNGEEKIDFSSAVWL